MPRTVVGGHRTTEVLVAVRARWELATEASSVPAVRSAARRFLTEAGSPREEREAVELVITELVTNSVVHSRLTGESIQVSVQVTKKGIHIEVRDHESEPPIVRTTGVDSPHGRGLEIVDGIATKWGWTAIEDNGKFVWCDVSRCSTVPEVG